jgi:hypothetical protein
MCRYDVVYKKDRTKERKRRKKAGSVGLTASYLRNNTIFFPKYFPHNKKSK